MKLILSLMVTLLATSFARAEVLASCGASMGYGYFVANGIISSENAGFSEDTIKNGVIQLTASSNKEFDVVHVDATGKKLSIVEDGAQLVPLFNGSNIHIIAVYPAGVVENYTFRFATNELTWTKSSFGALIDKTSVFKSSCLFE